MSDLEVIKTSHPAFSFNQAGEPLATAGKLLRAKTVLLNVFVLGLAQQGPVTSIPREKKEVFAVLRRPVQTDSANEQMPMLPFKPFTYWVVLGVAHPSPTCDPETLLP